MLIDIVILPPEKIRNILGSRMKKEVSDSSNFFVVDNKNLIPHLSLWHLKTSEKKLSKIAKELQQVVDKQKPIKVITSRFRVIKKYKGCVEFPVKNNRSLEILQKKVFEKIYHYKTGIMPPFASFLKLDKTDKKLSEIKKYGRSLGFHPHFTMGWLKNEEDILRVVKNMQKVKVSFLTKEIYICEVDRLWQVKRIIRKINFV